MKGLLPAGLALVLGALMALAAPAFNAPVDVIIGGAIIAAVFFLVAGKTSSGA